MGHGVRVDFMPSVKSYSRPKMLPRMPFILALPLPDCGKGKLTNSCFRLSLFNPKSTLYSLSLQFLSVARLSSPTLRLRLSLNLSLPMLEEAPHIRNGVQLSIVQGYLSKFYRGYGTWVARNPTLVLFASLSAVLVLCLGLIRFKVETRPEKPMAEKGISWCVFVATPSIVAAFAFHRILQLIGLDLEMSSKN
ncbi:hypothetical protein CRG98_000989 [Punica granatum]|uniref:Uncharacterized protein n=1 Tax=Punica granatum TaxID=22663 RepID=A0A2I0LD56_PUNGR|nr:hypothetical protein CRG98_000989 [Punica granatum]